MNKHSKKEMNLFLSSFYYMEYWEDWLFMKLERQSRPVIEDNNKYKCYRINVSVNNMNYRIINNK